MKIKASFLKILLLVFISLTACTQKNPPAPAATPITVQLKWVHQAQFAGFYVAADKGFYQDENIDINLLPGGVGIDIMDVVTSGQAQFGVIGAEKIILGRDLGKPVKAISTIYGTNSFVIAALPESGIKKPQDLIGKTVNVGGIDGLVQFTAMMNKLNLDINQIDIVPYSYDLTSFFTGEIDATPAIAAGSLIGIQKNRPDVNLIWTEEYGIHFYSDTIFCTDEMIKQQPDLVLRFLRATLKGERYAIENPQEAVEISMRYAVDQDKEVQTKMMLASIPLINNGYGKIGGMKVSVWEQMQDILFSQGLISKMMPIEEFVDFQFMDKSD